MSLSGLALLSMLALWVTSCAPPSDYSGDLADVINQYRSDRGLAQIPVSPSLTRVAELHVADLAAHPLEPGCNLHSWSGNGDWSACCYTDDHAEASCMWDKPSELTSYSGRGYEISSAGTSSPNSALENWRGSAGHHEVILNEGIWADRQWNAMGAAIQDGYAVVWFGEEPDL